MNNGVKTFRVGGQVLEDHHSPPVREWKRKRKGKEMAASVRGWGGEEESLTPGGRKGGMYKGNGKGCTRLSCLLLIPSCCELGSIHEL